MKLHRKIRSKVQPTYNKYLRPLLINSYYKVQCPICNWKGSRFANFNAGFGKINQNWVCPNCHSHPRHRSFYIYLKQVIPTNKAGSVLHFAPEEYLTKLFCSNPSIEYLSVDIDETKAMQKEDITNLSFADNSFDILFCSHVLEHVENDALAMQELFRVLKKGGFAIIDVPLDYSREQTYEDPTIVTPEARTKAYWQYDHVRLYGKDFPEKLKDAGFQVKSDEFIKTLGSQVINKHGLRDQPIYYCTKN